MNNNIKKVISASMLVSLLLANSVNAEELGISNISNSTNPISNGIVTCSTVTQDDFWNNFSNYDFYNNSTPRPTIKPTPQPTLRPTTEPTIKPVEKNEELINGFNSADRSVISYFSDAREVINNYLNSSDYTNLKSKAKGLVVTGIDFLFYDGTIKGYTRKELTEKGKEYIMKYISDTLVELDYYFPGISDTILDKYGKAKSTIIEKFRNILGYVKGWMGEEYYDMFGEEFTDIIDDFGDLGSIIGSLFDDKYQSWKLK